MQNGYFQLVKDSRGYGIAFYHPSGSGEEVRLDEVWKYLNDRKIKYDRRQVEMEFSMGTGGVCHLDSGDCPVCDETYMLTVSKDCMIATARFIPPSEGGKRLTMDRFLGEIRQQKITYGIKQEMLKEHFGSEGMYCTDILVARGDKPDQGEDARIEYSFNTDRGKRPAHLEDGRVDYYNLTTINQCRKGEVLARIIPERQGQAGHDVYGGLIKPRDVKKETLKFGKNITLSDDKLSITSDVDGHVVLLDGKVVVSTVYKVKDVDLSTGNIDYDGSIEISGSVTANMEVKAGGNVVINGGVESARVIAGGNIVIAKGMNGMGKGYLRAGGNIMVKFLENARVVTGGYLESEAIMHCVVTAGTDVRVDGRRGIILGGLVQAANSITAKTVGGSMSTATTLEVGVDPLIKSQYDRAQKTVEESKKTVDAAQVVFDNFKEKQKKGFKYNESQLRYMRSVVSLIQEKSAELEKLNTRIEELQAMMENRQQGEVIINEQAYPNTTIVIRNVSKTLQNDYRYCKFVKEDGEVRMVAM
ncbi:FapA family protein [uncultured Acetatifactor sp.]|uniref:FapA family protein n=1 Tax=uncultured Acetatifactor sp. TaxID=1671927 RepID=UPI00262A2F27|nr:FapA family protein [uncultured Acetatifactor sp.]